MPQRPALSRIWRGQEVVDGWWQPTRQYVGSSPPEASASPSAACSSSPNIRELAPSGDLGALRWLGYAMVLAACGGAARRPRTLRRIYA